MSIEKLNDIRSPGQKSKKDKILCTASSLIAGILLGVFSKWLDSIALDNNIWWHRIIERLDLGNFFSEMAIWLLISLAIAVFSSSASMAALNVFAFFAGMCAAYHLYSILFAGFNPSSSRLPTSLSYQPFSLPIFGGLNEDAVCSANHNLRPLGYQPECCTSTSLKYQPA